MSEDPEGSCSGGGTDILSAFTEILLRKDGRIQHETLDSRQGTVLKIHQRISRTDSVLNFNPAFFMILQRRQTSGSVNLVTLTYNEEVIDTRSVPEAELVADRTTDQVVARLNEPYRVCVGVEEGRVVDPDISKVLIEKYRSSIVYRSRDCLRVVRGEVLDRLRELCPSCLGISDLGLKHEAASAGGEEEAGSQELSSVEELSMFPDLPDYLKHEDLEDIPQSMRKRRTEKMFQCTEENCAKIFKREKTLHKHVAEFHSENVFVRCPVAGCRRTFKELLGNKMLLHLAKLHPDDPNSNNLIKQSLGIRCRTCDEPLSSLGSLRAHERSCRQPATCDECGQVCVTASTLKVHKRNVHSDECFVCEEPGCGRRVKTKASLLDHISSVHRNEKMYVCHGCGKDFRYRHQRRMCENKHMGKFIHPCHMCDKKFNDKRRFDQHMRVHTGEKPFVCPICSFRCARLDNLNLHTKKSHGVTWKEAEGMTGVSCKSKPCPPEEEESATLVSGSEELDPSQMNLLLKPEPYINTTDSL